MRNIARAVVTGAASGLGMALVTQLVADGAVVVGIDLAGDSRAAAVGAAGAEFVACDVTSQQGWRAAAGHIGQRLGSIDALFLNAGVMTRSPSDAIDDDPLTLAGSTGYRRVFAVNVDGVVFGVAALDPILADGGSVSVTASTAGLEANGFDPYYSMTKHAVIGLVRSIAKRFEYRRIAVNAFCPGGIDTAIVPHQIRSVVPAELLRPPEHIAASLVAMSKLDTTGGTWRPGDEAGTVYEYIVPVVG